METVCRNRWVEAIAGALSVAALTWAFKDVALATGITFSLIAADQVRRRKGTR